MITNKGDTLKCKVSTPFLGTSEYTLPDSSINVLEDTTQVKEYYIAKKKLLKRAVPVSKNKRQYLEVIENGAINLYQSVSTQTTVSPAFTHVYTVTVWYISKGSDKIFELKSTSITNTTRKIRKELLADFLKDNTAAYNMFIAQKQFTFESISDVVHFYNTGILPDMQKRSAKSDDVY